MNIPELRDVDQQGAVVREYEDDHATTIAVDFGPKTGKISVDIVDDTAIVVVENDQFEFELPDSVEEVSANNGVLTIEE